MGVKTIPLMDEGRNMYIFKRYSVLLGASNKSNSSYVQKRELLKSYHVAHRINKKVAIQFRQGSGTRGHILVALISGSA